MTVCLAALARAAAHTPRTALLRGHHPHDGHPTATLCLLAPDDLVHVPAAHPAGALDALALALDSLHRTPLRGVPDGWPAAVAALGYEAARAALVPEASAHDLRPPGDDFPATWMARVEAALRLDLVTGAVSVHPAAAAARLHATLDPWRTVPPAAHPLGLSLGDPEGHHAAVETVRAGIRDGAVYLVNVARVLQGAALPEGLVAETMAARFVEADPALGMLCHLGDARVSAMTMERALRWHRGLARADTAPIKGTRPRDRDDPARDAALAATLAADPKERAENAMAVDVHRNDLGRVALPGGVTVTALYDTEAHRYVHHLVSRVEARLPPDLDAATLLRAVLPVGSVTGAPKRAAMAFIARVERYRRGLYTGALGAVTADGGFDLAVAIRTLVADRAGLHYGVGGGVVWDSVAAREWDELVWKARAVTAG